MKEHDFKPMVLILNSIPGGGKGTQSKKLIHFFEERNEPVVYICTGDLLSSEIPKESLIFDGIKEAKANGDFVDDENVLYVVKKHLIHSLTKYSKKHIIFDGFPRNKKQVLQLLKIINDFKLQNVFSIQIVIDDKEAAKRMFGRGEGRADDKDGVTIYKKTREFYGETLPAIELLNLEFHPQSYQISGIGSPEEVFQRLLKAIGL